MTKEFIQKAHQIYNCLQDEESKKIFMYKLNWAITGDIDPLIQYAIQKDYNEFHKKIKYLAEENEVIIYGAGVNCLRVMQICKDIRINYICDRDAEKQAEGVHGIVVISPEELLKNHKNAAIIISTTKYQNEVLEQLGSVFSRDKIELFFPYEQERAKQQYFDNDIMKFSENEVFVDCGCYDFGTSKELMKKCKVKKIFAFEPDSQNLRKIEQEIPRYPECEIKLVKKGLWDKTAVLAFLATGDMESYIIESGQVEQELEMNINENAIKINVAAMDDIIKEPISFIKMDIEGSELKALQGAKNLIQTYRPKMAICIYHKPEDIIDIPAYIADLVSDYKFYIRQYSYGPCETVLYVV